MKGMLRNPVGARDGRGASWGLSNGGPGTQT